MVQAQSDFADFIILGLMLLYSSFTYGQTAFPHPDTSTIHVLSDLVQVPVLALKSPFRPVLALTPSDFVIRLDGGLSFHPTYARMEGAEPLTLSLLVEADTQGSNLLSQGLQAAVQNWPPDLLNGSDRLSVYIYDCRLVQSRPVSPVNLAVRRDELIQSLSLPAFEAAMEGGKLCPHPPIDELLEAAINQMAKTTNWKIILFIENGENKFDSKDLQKVQAFAAAQGVTLFAIKYLHTGSFPVSVYSKTEGINLLVSSLGGTTVPSSFDDLRIVTETIIKDVRQRYILSFQRPGNGIAGAHRLQITSTIKNVRVLTSAAAVPLLSSTRCSADSDSWLCSQDRPQYGTDTPQKEP